MEPANLNSDHDAELEALLRRTAPAIPDDGFSARVVAALPAPPRRNRSRFWAGAAGAALGVALVASSGGSWRALADGAHSLEPDLAALAALTGDPWLWTAAVLTALCLAYAFRREDAGPAAG